MSIRWRLSVLVLQLAVLVGGTYLVTGSLYSTETWFFAGLLGVVINLQLLEPFFSRPKDVIANSIFFLFLYMISEKQYTAYGWNFLAISLLLALFLASMALILGANRAKGRFVGFAKSAKTVSQVASATVIYSSVFLLSAIEAYPAQGRDFWTLLTVWALILVLGKVNWQAVWSTARGRETPCKVEGMIGPSLLLLSATDLPEPGARVSLKGSCTNAEGVVLNRIRRINDTWGSIHILDRSECEMILTDSTITVGHLPGEAEVLLGSVDTGSSDGTLKFISTKPLEIGNVVGVPLGGSDNRVAYQLSSAVIERSDVKGGSHLVVRAHANQLGIFDAKELKLKRHRWVPSPGFPIFGKEAFNDISVGDTPKDHLLIGHVIGTKIPIYLECKSACEGHLAILGMTKMGKSTLAIRIATVLSSDRRVVILDQTGEYVNNRGFTPCGLDVDWKVPGISVFEPAPHEVPAERAFEFLNRVVQEAVSGYKSSNIIPRTIIMDEAHQFIPEPAGLSFNARERESSIKIGLLMMQIRKYGISVFLISQRTAVVAKSALSQCENIIAFRSVDQTGLDYLEAVAGGGVRSLLPQLQQGEALIFGPACSSETPVAVTVIK